MKKISILLLSGILFFSSVAMYASPAGQYMHSQIQELKGCKNMALSDSSGMIMIEGGNGFSSYGIPKELSESLTTLNADNKSIYDICITESGYWYVVGDTLRGRGAPKFIYDKVAELCAAGEHVLCVNFNDNGIGIVITEKSISCNDNDILTALVDGGKKYGKLMSVCLRNKGLIAVYEEGFRKVGLVPDDLVEFLSETDLDIAYVKFTDAGSWFVGTENQTCSYVFK
ncbi:MAG: hypothetical protein K5829_14340 [Treponema sp.]|nr:hypothetical protein [Treponema sp.]